MTATVRQRPMILAVLVAGMVLWGTGPQALGQTPSSEPRPTLEDLFTVAVPGDLELSPDGTTVLYTVRTADLEKNRTVTNIWRVAVAPQPGAPVQLTRGERNDTRPRWHPDGRRFAFLSERPASEEARGEGERSGGRGGPDLYLMDAFGGEAERLYDHVTGIQAFEWSPDGTRIAFTARDEETEGEKEAKKKGRDVIVEDEPREYSHLWLLDAGARKARRLTRGQEYTVESFSWSPDGRRVAFAAAASPLITDSWKSDVYVLDVQDTAAVPRKLTANPGRDAEPVWTPDGRDIVYQGWQGEGYRIGYNRVFRMAAEGGAPEDVSPALDVEPGRYVFTPDGAGVFFEAVTGTTVALFYMPLPTRQPVRLTPDRGLYRGASFSRDRRRVAFVYESPERPAELYAAVLGARPGAGAVQATSPLTAHAAHAASWARGRTEVVRWRSADGREVEGLVVLPAGWAPGQGPRALVVKVHGGPSGVFLQNFQASSSTADAQRYAADGYAVFLPNPRGSSGYGDATVRAVINDWGGLDFQDIMAGVDTLVGRGIAHPDSLGIMGWSYGGYMTAWAVGQTERFKAAVAGAAITETISMWGTHDILHVFEGYFGGSPYAPGRWEEYQESSPLAFIRRAKTPTLIIHGMNDERVPPGQARLFYRALRANGVPTELVWLPRTPHGPREPGLQYETARRQKEWMDRWIRGKGRAAAVEGAR